MKVNPSFNWLIFNGKLLQPEQLLFALSGVARFTTLVPLMMVHGNSHDPDIHYHFPQDCSGKWSFIYLDFIADDKMINELINQSGHLFQMVNNAPIMPQLNAYLNSSLLGELAGSFINRRETASQVQLLRMSHKIIHSQMDQNINVQQLAERLSVSPEHLSRVFRKELNTSPLKCMNKEK